MEFIWTAGAGMAFLDLLRGLTRATMLALADMNKPFMVTTGALRPKIGVVLSQVHEGG